MTNALAGHAVGYAPQHDAALMGSLTVRQALNATAALLVVDKAEQARRVEDALTAMGLQHCADQRYAPCSSNSPSPGLTVVRLVPQQHRLRLGQVAERRREAPRLCGRAAW